MLKISHLNYNIIRFLSNLEQSKIIYGLLALLFAALIPFAWYVIQFRGLDFYAYFLAAKGLHQGTRFYLELMYGSTYYYPPLTAQILAPLSIFPGKWVFSLWLILSICAVILSVYLLGGKTRFFTNLIISFGFFPVADMLYTGQVESFMLLALSFTFFTTLRNRSIGAGVGLGVAILLKVVPLAHFCYFLWRKRFKIILSAILTLIILCASSLPFIGWQGWMDFFHVASYYANPSSMHGVNFEQLINSGANQSISGVIARFFPQDAISIPIWRISVIGFFIATAIILWKQRGEFVRVFDLEFSLVIITINLIMPYTWYHQFTLLIIPILVILKRAENDKFLQKNLWLLFVGYILTDLQLIYWHYVQNNFLLSTPFFFALMMWLILAKQIWCGNYSNNYSAIASRNN